MGRLRRSDEQQLVDTIARRIPTWKGNLLNAAGRTTLKRALMMGVALKSSVDDNRDASVNYDDRCTSC
jgi:hypothetical protein